MHGKRPTVSSIGGIVAAAHPHAAAAGARILAKGGNAFDAVAATAAALNVVEPYMSSLGGQGLATMWIAKEQRIRCLDFVPRIPSKFPTESFSKREDLQRGAHSVGTPGNLAGWAELNRTLGRLPLGDCLEPAIALARDGYPVTEFNVEETNLSGPDLKKFAGLYDPWAKTYTDGSGMIALNWVLRQPELARTLGQIAKHGASWLYGGDLGRSIVQHLGDTGGHLTMADLETFKPEWKDPLPARYRHLTVHVPPPPCEGFQYLLALRILEGTTIASLAHNGVEHLDLVWRAIRLAAGERIYNNNPSAAKLTELMSDTNVARLRKRASDGKPITGPTEQWMPLPADAREQHTTSFSIADKDGNVVCVTQSIGSPFGSGVIVPGAGLTLNNFLYWSDVQTESPNRSRPGDALPMCMSPSVSTAGGKPVLALGTPGSYGILQTQVQALVQHVDFRQPIQDAIEQPRARLWDGRMIEVENRYDPKVIDALKSRGHEIIDGGGWTMKVGGMHAIAIDPASGAKSGGCDPRRDGYVVPVA
jgi:gamma-glutamyltranspeptidase/glutathione hydrolase